MKKLEVYHTPTENCTLCLCINTDQFTVDCDQYIIDRYKGFTVNPKARFYSKIDKLIDEIIREVKKPPFKFRMRLDSRHSITSRNIHYRFQIFDRDSFKKDTLSEVILHEQIEPEIDFVVIYTGIQGLSKTDDKGGFYGPKP
ncbi:hypothetical protein MHI02_07270 [Oceanobacillus sp. FSL K6-0118]|uniref:hypothetical protein n=1 Tax=Oceanobacillus sp. FSL K6-0118 TaxID=2921418 RepID=UPI0030FA9571